MQTRAEDAELRALQDTPPFVHPMSDTKHSNDSDELSSSPLHRGAPDLIRHISQENLGPLFFPMCSSTTGQIFQHAKLGAFFDFSLRTRLGCMAFILVKFEAPSALPWHNSATIPTQTKEVMDTTQCFVGHLKIGTKPTGVIETAIYCKPYKEFEMWTIRRFQLMDLAQQSTKQA